MIRDIRIIAKITKINLIIESAFIIINSQYIKYVQFVKSISILFFIFNYVKSLYSDVQIQIATPEQAIPKKQK